MEKRIVHLDDLRFKLEGAVQSLVEAFDCGTVHEDLNLGIELEDQVGDVGQIVLDDTDIDLVEVLIYPHELRSIYAYILDVWVIFHAPLVTLSSDLHCYI